MDPEHARIDRLCPGVADAEWRVVSGFSSFFFARVGALKILRARGLMER